MWLKFLFISIWLNSVLAMRASVASEGYPMGFMSDCPGSEKKSFISKKNLRKLSLTLLVSGNTFSSTRRLYNYYQIKDLMKDPGMDFTKKTAIFIGGYMDSVNFPLASAMMFAYKDAGYNALTLDVNRFNTYEYPIACRYMRPVGLHAAEMLANLTALGLDPKSIECAGLSLGAHTCGYIAKHYQRITGKKISKIVGMDPAGPCFRNLVPADRLDKSDADEVVMIATNMDSLGMATPTGHVNFYVNGGEYQPGDLIHFTACFTLCSHARSFLLWVAALENPNKFIGMKCDSIQQARMHECYDREPLEINTLDIHTNVSNPGIFYLATHNLYPFYMGKKGLKKENQFWFTHLRACNDKDEMTV